MGALKVIDVSEHPTDRNKLRVTFSEAFNVVGAETPANYVLTPGSFSPVYVVTVAGSGNTQVDLHFGTELVVDANTYALWTMEEASGNLLDSGPNSLALTPTNATVIADGLYKKCRSFSGTFPSHAALTTAAPRPTFLGEVTVEALVRLTAFTVTFNGYLFAYTGQSSSDTQAENTLFAFGVTPAGRFVGYWENGAGVDNTTLNVGSALSLNSLYHLAMRKRLVGSLYEMALFINGQLAGSGLFANCDGGTSANMQLALANLGTNSASFTIATLMDSVRIQNIALTDAQILASAQSLLGTLVRNTDYTLQVSNVEDAATSTPITLLNGGFFFSYLRNSSLVDPPSAFSTFYSRVSRLVAADWSSLAASVVPLRYYAARLSFSQVRVSFTARLADIPATYVAANYSITGPGSISVDAVAFTPGDAFLDLTVSGSWVVGVYTLILEEHTARDSDGNFNNGTATFSFASPGGGLTAFNEGFD